ncbi:MAG: iron-sulfur cluster-binding domain-containing protein [Deltaproteobacteria bacterium]|nr:iron-sulfur cluster-binding domain-containing protein [Deltaproteobacteria bacterium]
MDNINQTLSHSPISVLSKFGITVKGHLKDLLAFINLTKLRRKHFQAAADAFIAKDRMNELSAKLHPSIQYLVIDQVYQEAENAKTYKLIPAPDAKIEKPAYFRAGQYICITAEVAKGVVVNRPYSISSAPVDAQNGYYEITIKRNEDGFVAPYIWEHWQPGMHMQSSGPEGHFYYEALRDRHCIIALAGGSGITPFRSFAREIVHGNLDIELTIFYGNQHDKDILFLNELNELAQNSKGRIKVIHVLQTPSQYKTQGQTYFEEGLLTKDLIKKHVDVKNSTIFICGPQAMYNFLATELAPLELSKKQIRWELFGAAKDIMQHKDFPKEQAGKSYTLNCKIANSNIDIPASSTESILVAIERAKLQPVSKCRSGECGFCRSKLLSGQVFIPEENDKRRAMDKKAGYFYPCVSYPIENLSIE